LKANRTKHHQNHKNLTSISKNNDSNINDSHPFDDSFCLTNDEVIDNMVDMDKKMPAQQTQQVDVPLSENATTIGYHSFDPNQVFVGCHSFDPNQVSMKYSIK
jgi:hypothetical protein